VVKLTPNALIDAKIEIFWKKFLKMKKIPKNHFKNSRKNLGKLELFRLYFKVFHIYILSTLNHFCRE
jgi:hypothetical protein